MSTLADSGIPFDISNEQQNFRLLELPPSLLALVATRDPPSLWLKSAGFPNAYNDSQQPNAVLCTDNRTFQLRQVQSSNSVFILQPSEKSCGDNQSPTQSLSAIAQCTSTLELVPLDTAASFATISQLLKNTLRAYKGPDMDIGLGQDTKVTGECKDKDAILYDAPFSKDEVNEIWKQSCAFEAFGRPFLPTPSALAMVWKSILSAATIRGVNLEKRFDLNSLAEMVTSDGFPWELVTAVVAQLVSDNDYLKNDGVNLSKDKTIQWVGVVCLQMAGELNQPRSIPQSEFLAQWHDLLPEGWRKHASMDVLKAKYSHSDLAKDRLVLMDDLNDPTSLNNNPPSAPAGKANRNWHEKFKAGRK